MCIWVCVSYKMTFIEVLIMNLFWHTWVLFSEYFDCLVFDVMYCYHHYIAIKHGNAFIKAISSATLNSEHTNKFTATNHDDTYFTCTQTHEMLDIQYTFEVKPPKDKVATEKQSIVELNEIFGVKMAWGGRGQGVHMWNKRLKRLRSKSAASNQIRSKAKRRVFSV